MKAPRDVAKAAKKSRLVDFSPLSPAEKQIVSELRHGEFDRLGDGRVPAAPEPARLVRADFLRFIILGGDDEARPHEKGIRVSGGWIKGVLDLEGCRVPRDIRLRDCHLEGSPNLGSAIIDNLFLEGSVIPGLQAVRLEARGGIYLRSAKVAGEIRLSGARLNGSLECDGATIHRAEDWAIVADGLASRSVLLRGATVNGGINLIGARLSADFDATGAAINHQSGIAINAESSTPAAA